MTLNGFTQVNRNLMVLQCPSTELIHSCCSLCCPPLKMNRDKNVINTNGTFFTSDVGRWGRAYHILCVPQGNVWLSRCLLRMCVYDQCFKCSWCPTSLTHQQSQGVRFAKLYEKALIVHLQTTILHSGTSRDRLSEEHG